MSEEASQISFRIDGVLEKFDGEGTDPEKLVERVHIEDGVVAKVETIENGVVTDTKIFDEGGTT